MGIHIDELLKMTKAEEGSKLPTKNYYGFEIQQDEGDERDIYELSGNYVLPGAENWKHVVSIQEGGYEWAELHAYYDPERRRYFWAGESGCSCNSYDEFVTKVEDFENGSKEDLVRAVDRFVDEYDYYFKSKDAVAAKAEIARFSPKEA